MASNTIYPECEKVKEHALESHTIGSFLEWLKEKGLHICEYQENGVSLQYIRQSNEQLIAEHLGIDLKKYESEKQQILKQIG